MSDSPIDEASRRARFEETALPHLRRVYNVALRLARRPEDASDLAQETYLRAYRTFDNFRAGTACKAWLLTILYSVFINRYWKRKREGEAVPVEALEENYHRLLAAGSRDDEGSALRAANLDRPAAEVVRALSELPESFRAAVVLVDMEDLSYEEAAAALQCPVGTLRSRLFRARKLLFVALRGYALEAGYLKTPGEH
jgi:RNA polymerase sigma-70 factor (ECF subfamily)